MSQLTLNGACTPIDPGMETWQQLLTDLESRRLARDEVIASVSFDGDEILQFRDAQVLGVSLRALDEVRVEAISREDMLRTAIHEARQYLDSLRSSTLAVAELFRHEKLNQANPALTQLFEGFKLFLGLLRGIELTQSGLANGGDSLVEKNMVAIGATLEEQIKAQTAQDWMLLADILEYDLAPHLDAFEEMLAPGEAETTKEAMAG